MALPNTYKQVEYIQSSGTQYIDTGMFASNNLQVETKVLIPSYSTIGPFFGCILSGWQNAGGNYFHCTPYNSKFYCGVNNSEVNGGTTTANQEYTIIFNNASGYLNVNGSNVVSVSGTVGYTGTTIGISGRGGIDGTTYGRFGYNRYYYFKIYNKTAGEYVRDMVPVIRKSDNKPGMYDLVNDVFYTNAGTGEFTYKEYAESGKITHIYLGTNLIRPNELPKSFYYDFRNSSVAAIQQDWTMNNPGNVQYSTTNGIGRSGSAECSLVYINGINLSNVTKKVTMKVGVIRPSSGGVYGAGFSLNNSTKGIQFHDNGQNVMVYDTNGQGTSSRPTRSIVGQTGYDLYEWDFENNVMKMTPLGLSTYSYTMQTGQLDIVKTFNRLSGGISTMWWRDILIEWE